MKKLDIEGIEDSNNSSLGSSENESVEADEVDTNLYADYKGSATDSDNTKLRVLIFNTIVIIFH